MFETAGNHDRGKSKIIQRYDIVKTGNDISIREEGSELKAVIAVKEQKKKIPMSDVVKQ